MGFSVKPLHALAIVVAMVIGTDGARSDGDGHKPAVEIKSQYFTEVGKAEGKEIRVGANGMTGRALDGGKTLLIKLGTIKSRPDEKLTFKFDRPGGTLGTSWQPDPDASVGIKAVPRQKDNSHTAGGLLQTDVFEYTVPKIHKPATLRFKRSDSGGGKWVFEVEVSN